VEGGAAEQQELPTDGWRAQLLEKIALNLPQKLILQRAFVYAFIAAWSLYQSAATGPAFQVRDLRPPGLTVKVPRHGSLFGCSSWSLHAHTSEALTLVRARRPGGLRIRKILLGFGSSVRRAQVL